MAELYETIKDPKLLSLLITGATSLIDTNDPNLTNQNTIDSTHIDNSPFEDDDCEIQSCDTMSNHSILQQVNNVYKPLSQIIETLTLDMQLIKKEITNLNSQVGQLATHIENLQYTQEYIIQTYKLEIQNLKKQLVDTRTTLLQSIHAQNK